MKYFLSLALGLLSFVSVSHALMAADYMMPERMAPSGSIDIMPAGCAVWNDGCNDCLETHEGLECPIKNCATMRMGYCRVWEGEETEGMREEDYFLDPYYEEPSTAQRPLPVPFSGIEIPRNCVSWYDGCNTCGAENGELTFCTQRACIGESREEPYCRLFKEQKPDIPKAEPDIPFNCLSWFDGCNNCGAENGKLTSCTERYCVDWEREEPYCRNFKEQKPNISVVEPKIPLNCETWFDGCNRCQVMSDGGLACTRMACSSLEPSKCLAYREEVIEKPPVLVPAVTEIMEVTIGPELVQCDAFRLTCLVMNGEFFDGWIDGFDFEPGFNYQLKISKTKRQERVLDMGDYQYELLEVISKTPNSKVDDYKKRIIPADCLNWNYSKGVCNGYGGELPDETGVRPIEVEIQIEVPTIEEEPKPTDLITDCLFEDESSADCLEELDALDLETVPDETPSLWGFIKYHLFGWWR